MSRCLAVLSLAAALLTAPAGESRADDISVSQEVLSAEQIAYVLAATKSVSGGYSKIDLPSVTFEVNSATLTVQARQQLDQVAKALIFPAFRDKPIKIAGHTDASGNADYNMALSERRAQSVLTYLEETHGIVHERMTAQGLGETSLLPDKDADDADQRRVEFSLR